MPPKADKNAKEKKKTQKDAPAASSFQHPTPPPDEDDEFVNPPQYYPEGAGPPPERHQATPQGKRFGPPSHNSGNRMGRYLGGGLGRGLSAERPRAQLDLRGNLSGTRSETRGAMGSGAANNEGRNVVMTEEQFRGLLQEFRNVVPERPRYGEDSRERERIRERDEEQEKRKKEKDIDRIISDFTKYTEGDVVRYIRSLEAQLVERDVPQEYWRRALLRNVP